VTAGRREVMVIDDDPDVRDMIGIILSGRGIDAVGEGDGATALEHLRQGALPSLILLDLMMPRLSGADFLREVRRDPRLGGIPVVVLSGDNEAVKISEALGVGCCLRKPVELDDLIDVVSRLASAPPGA
jgi:CheY-like chemotaxis protein